MQGINLATQNIGVYFVISSRRSEILLAGYDLRLCEGGEIDKRHAPTLTLSKIRMARLIESFTRVTKVRMADFGNLLAEENTP